MTYVLTGRSFLCVYYIFRRFSLPKCTGMRVIIWSLYLHEWNKNGRGGCLYKTVSRNNRSKAFCRKTLWKKSQNSQENTSNGVLIRIIFIIFMKKGFHCRCFLVRFTNILEQQIYRTFWDGSFYVLRLLMET